MIDSLIDAIKDKKNPSVAGLDPTWEMMPDTLKKKYQEKYLKITPEAVSEMFYEFNRKIIDEICDIVPAVKLQIAMYEKWGDAGITAYNESCKYALAHDMIVIGDIKRGDISSTAAAYAAHIGGAQADGDKYMTWHEDAVTVNPYMGSDGIKPFTDVCRRDKKGIFVLLKTSNPSSSELQDLLLQDGRTVYEAVADSISQWGSDICGTYGYSEVGAVVGATHKAQGESLRKRMPHTFFLVPGYGAQGAGADDVAGFFDSRGIGAIISSSRGITAAYKNDENYSDAQYDKAARAAAVKMRDNLMQAIAMQK